MGSLCGDVSINEVQHFYIHVGYMLGSDTNRYDSLLLPDHSRQYIIHTLAIDTVRATGDFAENPGSYQPDKVPKKHFKETCANCKILIQQAVNRELAGDNISEGSFIDHYILMPGTSFANCRAMQMVTYFLVRGEYVQVWEKEKTVKGKDDGEKSFDRTFAEGWCQSQGVYHELRDTHCDFISSLCFASEKHQFMMALGKR